MNIKYNNDNLKKLQRKLKELNGKKQIPLTELLTDDFVKLYTDFKNLQALIDTCGIEAMEKQTDEFARFISLNTRFSTWEEMLKAAGAEYTKRKLGL